MKNILSIILVFVAFNSFGQKTEKPLKVAELEIKVSAVCGMCKKKIEKELNYTKGIVFCEVNLDEGLVKVKYKTKVLKADEIRNLIVNLGYSADGIPANKEAHAGLPECCKSEGCGE